MTTRLQEALDRIRENLAELDRLEREILRTRGFLGPLPGTCAVDVAVSDLGRAREALGVAEEELEVEDGTYLDPGERS